MNKILIFLLSFYFLSSSASASDELVLDASNSFAITVRKNSQMPIKSLIKQSKAIIIFPSITKIGLVLGGMRGDGGIESGDEMLVANISEPRKLIRQVGRHKQRISVHAYQSATPIVSLNT